MEGPLVTAPVTHIVTDAPSASARMGACAPAAATVRGIVDSVVAGQGEAATPRQVIRGESQTWETTSEQGEKLIIVKQGRRLTLVALPQPSIEGHPYAALTDFLNCTFPYDAKAHHPTQIAFELAEYMGEAVTPAIDRGRGLHGYQHAYDLGNSSAQCAFGGQRETALLSLPGRACALVKDWPGLRHLLEVRYKARITRWDGAIDDLTGTHPVDWAVEQYLAGLFGSGGRKPSCSQKGNWIEPDGTGRTFYIGKRENGKMLRVYEKGMQLGIPWHPWVRWEVEMHNRDRIIPWDVIERPGSYTVGAYPKALAWANEENERIVTLHHEATSSYEALTAHAQRTYGKHINLMVEVEGSAEKVVKKLIRDGLPARLDHPAFIAPGGGLV